MSLSDKTVAKRLGLSRTTECKYRKPLAAVGQLEGDPNGLPDLAELEALVSAEHGEPIRA